MLVGRRVSNPGSFLIGHLCIGLASANRRRWLGTLVGLAGSRSQPSDRDREVADVILVHDRVLEAAGQLLDAIGDIIVETGKGNLETIFCGRLAFPQSFDQCLGEGAVSPLGALQRYLS